MNVFKIVQGNLPLLTVTLLTAAGTPVDLTGCTVALAFQLAPAGLNFGGAAAVNTPATAGVVAYQFTGDQTMVPGNYQGQWRVTKAPGPGLAPVVSVYPLAGYFYFEMVPALPVAAPAFDKLADFFDDIRALTGDFHRRIYQDNDIASVMRVQLRMGRVHGPVYEGVPTGVWGVTPDILGIRPAIGPTDILAYSLLVYHTAHQLVLPNTEAYSYRTRALSERFGERKDFLFALQNTLYEMEHGAQAYASVSGLRNWLFAINGIWVWSWLQAETNIELSMK